MGEPFADLDGWEPGVAAAARVAELVRRAEEQLVAAWLAAGQYQEALSAATAQVEREPFREQRWAALALAHYRAGRQAEALRTIRRARVVLADELGLEPGPELVGLERSILAQEPHLAGPAPVEGWWAGGCPYRGLAAYDVDDGDWFFGRDRETAECLGIVDATGFVAIVGASGSGKSSLARAGVAPALRRDGRDVAVVTRAPTRTRCWPGWSGVGAGGRSARGAVRVCRRPRGAGPVRRRGVPVGGDGAGGGHAARRPSR